MRDGGVRRERLASAIRETLTQLLLREMNDPRLTGVVVSAVELSKDLKRAQAYFSVVGDAERERQAADGLAQARGLLRREVGRRLRLRVTPELGFARDRGFERADRVDRILGEITFSDESPSDESPAVEDEGASDLSPTPRATGHGPRTTGGRGGDNG